LLIVNSALMIVIYKALVSVGPNWLKEEAIAQAILFIGPLLLVFIEWAIIDWGIEIVFPARHDDATQEERRRNGE
jgi:hypothetical protein